MLSTQSGGGGGSPMISDIGDLKISLGQVKSHSGNSSSIVFIMHTLHGDTFCPAF